MKWLNKAQALEHDKSEIGTLLFADAITMAIREELEAWKHIRKVYSRLYQEMKGKNTR